MATIREKFRARVVDNQDPTQRGRIRVTCPGLIGDDETSLPDWVEPSRDWGMFIVPDIGELVEIECNSMDSLQEDVPFQAFLENPDIRWNGVRLDSLGGGTSRPVNAKFTEKNYGKRRGFATPAGHVLMFDDTDGDQQIYMTWRKGDDLTTLMIDADGSTTIVDHKNNMINMNAVDGSEKIVISDYNSNVVELGNGAIKITAPGNVDVTCVNATVDADAYALGKGADSPLMRHTDWLVWATAHTHPTALGPSGPPVVPPTASIASQIGTLKCSIWAVFFAFMVLFWSAG